MVEARCDCGTIKFFRAYLLMTGATKSCGCYNSEIATQKAKSRATHGMSKTNIYMSWSTMVSRCYTPTHGSFPKYGARGVGVCDRWRYSFSHFYSDMGNKPTPKHTIERINSAKDYSPDNCRWATQAEQNRNKNNNHIIVYNGRSQCLMDWANETGIGFHTLAARIKNGWTLERAMTEPVQIKRRRNGIPITQ